MRQNFVKIERFGPIKSLFNTMNFRSNSVTNFAQLLSIFNGMNKIYYNSANIRQYWTVFPSDFNNIYLKYFGAFTEFNEK